MFNRPALSIIIPVYNIDAYINACIDSIVRQTYKNWELIIVDDGSTDNSGRICDYYAKLDSRIIVIHQQNSGVSAARNKGLEIVRGDYITFVDGDDEIGTDDTFELNISILDNNQNIDFLQFPIAYIRDNKTINYHQYKTQIINNRDEIILSRCNEEIPGYICSKIFRKYLFTNQKFPTDMTLAEDAMCLLQIIGKSNSCYLSNLGQYRYKLRQSSATQHFNKEKSLNLFKGNFEYLKYISKFNIIPEKFKSRLFFTVLRQLLYTRIFYFNKINLEAELNILKCYFPRFRYVMDSNLKFKYKIWWFLISIFSIKIFTNEYVKFVILKEKIISKNYGQ